MGILTCIHFPFSIHRERNGASRAARRAEKKMKDMMMQIDDERRIADQYKEQVSERLFGTKMGETCRMFGIFLMVLNSYSLISLERMTI